MNMEYTGKTSNTQKRKPKGDIKYNIDLNDEQKNAKRFIMENDITVLKGAAGSGKTILSCLIALDMFNKREIEKIIIFGRVLNSCVKCSRIWSSFVSVAECCKSLCTKL